jgi:hypothetical protein
MNRKPTEDQPKLKGEALVQILVQMVGSCDSKKHAICKYL